MSDVIPLNIRLNRDDSAVVILDQTLLPNETVFLELSKPDELFDAIAVLRVRGAPAIGIFAAFALYVYARGIAADCGDYSVILPKILSFSTFLCTARPTAVNLQKQLDRMVKLALGHDGSSVSQALESMKAEAQTIQREDIDMCRAISEHGLTLVRRG